MKYDIFISYSRKDSDIVKKIVKTLEDLKLKVWFDQTGIESGEEFINKIVRAIDNSDSVLFMYSDHAIEGEWTQKEVTYAKKQGKVVRPILIYGSMPTKGWFTFLYGNVDCIDYTDQEQVKKLLSNLCDTYLTQEPTENYQRPTSHDDVKESKNLQGTANKPKRESYKKSTSTDSFEFYISNGKAGFRDKTTHKMLIPFIYEDAFVASDFCFAVRNNGQWGFVDLHGDPICPIKYTEVNEFHDGLALVKLGNSYGYLNEDGDEVIPCIYETAYPCSCDRAVMASLEGLPLVMDKNGKIVFRFDKYKSIRPYKEGYCVVNGNTFFNIEGKRCFSQYDFSLVQDFSEGYSWVVLDGDWAILSLYDGSVVKPHIIIDEPEPFKEGLSIYRKDYSYGIINTRGQIIVKDSIYNRIYPYSEGLAPVAKNVDNMDLYGFIDKNGTLVFPIIYPAVSYFVNGVATVRNPQNGLCGCINKKGKVVVPFEYISISPLSEGLVIARYWNTLFRFFQIEKSYIIDVATGKKTSIPKEIGSSEYYAWDYYNESDDIRKHGFINGRFLCFEWFQHYILDKYGNFIHHNDE